jgi:hypothetical protein
MIEENFVGIIAMSGMRVGGTMNAISVELAGFQFGKEDVPIGGGAVPIWVEVDDGGRRGAIRSVK